MRFFSTAHICVEGCVLWKIEGRNFLLLIRRPRIHTYPHEGMDGWKIEIYISSINSPPLRHLHLITSEERETCFGKTKIPQDSRNNTRSCG
jgi:hypothetical protein